MFALPLPQSTSLHQIQTQLHSQQHNGEQASAANQRHICWHLTLHTAQDLASGGHAVSGHPVQKNGWDLQHSPHATNFSLFRPVNLCS